MKYLFRLYYEFYWKGAFFWFLVWTGLFYKFLRPYPVNLVLWWIPSLIPLAVTALLRSSLYIYYLLTHDKFFNKPKVIEFLAKNPQFTLSQFSKATRKPQVIAHYFLIHSPFITTDYEDSCIYKVKEIPYD
jgi:hypothetical protein